MVTGIRGLICLSSCVRQNRSHRLGVAVVATTSNFGDTEPDFLPSSATQKGIRINSVGCCLLLRIGCSACMLVLFSGSGTYSGHFVVAVLG